MDSAEQDFQNLLTLSLKRTHGLFRGNYGMKPNNISEIRQTTKDLKRQAEFVPPPSEAPVDERGQEIVKFGSVSAPTAFSKKETRPQGGELARLDRLSLAKPKAAIIPQKHNQWRLKRVVSGHQGWVRCLAVDSTNEWFASGGNDRLIKIWDMATNTLKLSLTGHINTVRALAVSSRHPYLFSCGEDQQVKCWDLEYNKAVRSYHGHLSGVYSLALHPSLDLLASGGRDAVVRLWDLRTKAAVHVLSGHTGAVMDVQAQNSEPQLISGSNDKMIRAWDIVAGRCQWVLTHHHKSIRSLAFHPKEYTFASGGADAVKIWRCPKGTFDRNVDSAGGIVNCVAVKDDGPNGSVLFAGTDSGGMNFYDWKTGRKFQGMETIPQPGSLAAENGIFACAFDRSETRLLTAECDKTIKVWEEFVGDPEDVEMG